MKIKFIFPPIKKFCNKRVEYKYNFAQILKTIYPQKFLDVEDDALSSSFFLFCCIKSNIFLE
jgi:hypothetical protein